MRLTSSEGEHHAVRGIREQHLYSAHLIHRLLFERDQVLDWIWLLDKDALSIDDFQYAVPGEVHAFQVKWKENPAAKGWASLLGPDGKKPPMIKQLAEAWISLRRKHPRRRVFVHLVHNSPASKDQSSGQDVSLNEFLERGWLPAQAGDSTAYQSYGATWEELRAASGLSEEQFAQFVPDSQLQFGVVKPTEHDDVRVITNWINRTVATKRNDLQFTQDQLLNELGWASDYQARPQEFNVPSHYEEIHATAAEVRQRIAVSTSGYIAVLGSPGSGKSTLLTHVLAATANIRLIKYYAFAPDEHYGARGEATDFLHSITLQLQRSGVFVREQRRPARSERLKLIELLEAQFKVCHSEFRSTGLRTVVLVDGLDHIERELQPERSLLKDLPLPESLPEGVVIVLGSQKLVLEGLPAPIKVHLELGNVVLMAPMAEDAMERTIDRLIPDAKLKNRLRIREVADGHPLALNYLLESLKSKRTEEWDVVLDNAERFTGDIDVLYRKHWNDIDPDADLRHALGIMARFRGPIPMRVVQEWISARVRDVIGKNLRHYFEVKRDGSWSFFHNSFRLFLQAVTKVPVLAETQDELDRGFHRELASKLRQAPEPWCWEALAHDYRAGEHDIVRSTTSLGVFKRQVMAFRHPSAVLEDLELVMRTAVVLHDPLLLVRAILISADIEQRHEAFDEEAITGALIRLGHVDKVMAYLLDGNRLRVSLKDALHACAVLVEQGYRSEGERLFKVAQPLECVNFKPIGRTLGHHEEAGEVLKAWAIAASYFIDPAVLLDCVEQLQFEREEYAQRTPEQLSNESKSDLLFWIADSYAKMAEWGPWMQTHAHLKELSMSSALFALTRAIEGFEENDASGNEALFELLTRTPKPPRSVVDGMYRTALSLRVVNVALNTKDKGKANEWLNDIERIPLHESGIEWSDGDVVRLAFRKARVDVRLHGRLPNDSVDRDEAVTDWPRTVEEDMRERARLVRRAVYDMVAFSFSDSEHRRPLQPSGELRWVANLMVDDPGAGIHRKLYFDRVRPELIRCLVQVLRSEKEITELVDYCLACWPARYQRVLAHELLGFGYDALVEELADAVLLTDAQGGQPHNRVADLKEQIDLRLILGKHGQAEELLRELVAAARGPISEKDYQWSTWADWLVQTNAVEPSLATERDRIMLERLLAMHSDSTDAGAAIDTLLIDVYRMKPGAAVLLTRILQERGDVDHASALSAVLLASTRDEAVSSTTVLRIMEDLLVPFTWVGDIDLLPELLLKLKRQTGAERVRSAVADLVRLIRAKANHKDRHSWFFHLTKALEGIGLSPKEAGIDPEELIDRRRREEERSPVLHLVGEAVVQVSEAAERVNSVSDYRALRARQDPGKSYSSDWPALIQLAVHKADLSELELWAEIVENEFEGRKGVNALSDIAGRLHASGREDAAARIATEAVALCDAGGWIQIFDGASKIIALNKLRSIDKRASMSLALNELGMDCGSGSLQYKLLIQGLGDIVPLLFDDIPWVEVWSLLEEYLVEFCAAHKQSIEDVGVVLNEVWGSAQDRSRSLFDVLLLHLDHPSHHVASAGIRCTARLLLERDFDAVGMVANLDMAMQRSERALVNSLVALHAVSMRDKAKARVFKELVEPLRHHSNLLVRVHAQHIINELENQEQGIERIDRELPFVYRIEQPRFMETASHMIEPFKYVIQALAGQSGLDVDQCLARWKSHFRTRMVERTWLQKHATITDDELKTFLERTIGRIGHIRARIHPSVFALLRCIGEIWDAGRIDRRGMLELVGELLHHDPTMVLLEPRPKPIHFNIDIDLKGSTSWSELPDDWLSPQADALEKLMTYHDQGWNVLAERTNVRTMASNSLVEETRMSGYFGPKVQLSNSGIRELPFVSSPRHTAEGYFTWNEIDINHLIVAQNHRMCETPGSRWIAVNPVVARSFGLKAGSGLFQWVDDQGVPAIETAWFSHGGLLNHAPGDHTPVAEGFLVICRTSFMEKLALGGFQRAGMIARSVDKSGDHREGSVSSALSLRA